jgi:Protein of unknown function (DUF1569)
MALPSIFNPSTTQNHLERLDKLTPSSAPKWGKMNSAQMLAHLNVAYTSSDLATTPKKSFFARLMMKLFVKEIVVGEKPYAKNSRTAPEFIIADARDFEKEKAILIANMKDIEAKGESYFSGSENPAFGVLTIQEWSNLFCKHIEHHFEQFGI